MVDFESLDTFTRSRHKIQTAHFLKENGPETVVVIGIEHDGENHGHQSVIESSIKINQ
jgi:hypothetical protein